MISKEVKDLKDHLELITKEMKEIGDEITIYVERKQDSFGTQLKAMGVDSHEKVGHWGGGDYGEKCGECAGDYGEVYSFQEGQKGKGKGNYGTYTRNKGGTWNDKVGEWTTKGKGRHARKQVPEAKGKGKGSGNFN